MAGCPSGLMHDGGTAHKGNRQGETGSWPDCSNLAWMDGTRRGINAAFVAPFVWIWMFVALLFVPLLISVIHAARRRKGT
jgi:hypothetical protein